MNNPLSIRAASGNGSRQDVNLEKMIIPMMDYEHFTKRIEELGILPRNAKFKIIDYVYSIIC